MRKFKFYFLGFWFVLLMIIEWFLTTIGELWEVIRKAFEDLAEGLESEMEKFKVKDEPDSEAK